MLNNYLEKYNLFKIIQEHLFNESSFSSKVTNIAINFQEIISPTLTTSPEKSEQGIKELVFFS